MDIPTLEPLPFDAPWDYELRIPRDPRSPRIARLTLRAVLGDHGLAELTDRAELLATELATNAVRHTDGPALLRFQWLHPVLRVSVGDTRPSLPLVPGHRPVRTALHAENGRGLLILDVLADRWGGCGTGDEHPGKTIWFELALTKPEPEPSAA
ncbi:ATP-binding protein [Streptomyces sp. V2]|uniref:ATP-binding protein n=1 Tax=Streptomyces sp. V2 TaxID=1424099 RepID=UPI000D66EDF8|nr:ATP-binding protein [Streptomyces sp. V2]PWG13795.1 ATP-binding protein [Streptomyces sp. V2]